MLGDHGTDGRNVVGGSGQALLNKYAARYKEDEKKLYKEKIFARMEAKNKALQAQEQQKELEEAFDDMPALE